jgi:NADPH2:quinone reductase
VTAAALKPSDRWLASGVRYANRSPDALPAVVGADGVGILDDGNRVAFFAPQRPYGGMAERALVRRGMWFELPDGVSDVMAAGLMNPGMAAWKALMWEGELTAGQSVLVLGATGTSGRIATQLAQRHGARVAAAGRNRGTLEWLSEHGADVTIELDQRREILLETLLDAGPYDLVVDYLWGSAAETLFAALERKAMLSTGGPDRTLYVQVGMSAGEAARLPALALRSAPLRLFGSGTGRQPGLDEAALAFNDLLQQVSAGEVAFEVEPMPLAEIERAWASSGGDHRIVLVP